MNGLRALAASALLAVACTQPTVPTTTVPPPAPTYSGAYTLDLTADCPPNSGFPVALRHRRYPASLSHDTSYARLSLSGAALMVSQSGFSGALMIGNVVEGGFSFSLSDSYDWGIAPSVAERLSDNELVMIVGFATIRQTPTGFSGVLRGSFGLYGTQYPLNFYDEPAKQSCSSEGHTFTLTR